MDLTVRLPRLFAEDHYERDLPTGELVSESKRFMTFRITDKETLDEWISDASFYSDVTGMDFEAMHSIARSARRCVEILRGVSAELAKEE